MPFRDSLHCNDDSYVNTDDSVVFWTVKGMIHTVWIHKIQFGIEKSIMAGGVVEL